MKVKVNGEEININEGKTLVELIQHYELHPGSVAVEINFEIIPKFKYPETKLKDGDCIEIVQFVGGG